MVVEQSFNKRIGAWVKIKKEKGGLGKILDVKQIKPTVPFKGVKIKGQ